MEKQISIDEANLVPLFYTVASRVTEEQIEFIIHALKITPVVAAFVTNSDDIELAKKLCDTVLQVSTLSDAMKLAQESDEASIIISGELPFAAHYADRVEEILA
jgi:hypothetical protein